jgi:imidazole glycerol-phosphate synthase subunit HisH
MMNRPIVIIDYGMGNLRSVEKAFEKAGARVTVSSKPADIRKAGKLVLPGVGAFSHAMKELKRRKLVKPILEKIEAGTPYLGLCLGLQLLFQSSEEGPERGLGVFKGRVKKFKHGLKVPHMGWNSLAVEQKKCPIFKGITPKDYFYFVHSFYAVPSDKNVAASATPYGMDFCSAVWKNNVYATQFHPEKSQAAGQRIIKNFVDLC